MIPKTRTLALIAMTIILCANCRLDLATDIYLSDITDLATEPVYLSATLTFDTPSEENKEQVVQILNSFFIDVTNIRIEDETYGDCMVADIKVPLYIAKTDYEAAETPFEIRIENQKDRYIVSLQLNKTVWKNLNSDISALTYQGFNIKETGITFRITNDLKKDYSLEFSSVYVNEKPVPYTETVVAEPKRTFAVKLSNVLQDILASDDYNQVRFFSLIKQAER